MKITSKEKATHEIRYVYSPVVLEEYEYWLVPMWMADINPTGEHVAWVKAKKGERVPTWLKRDWVSGKLPK